MSYRGEFRDGMDQAGWTGRRIVFFGLGFFILIGVIMTVIHFATKPLEVLDKVTDADRMIYNYQWFHIQWGQVKAVDDQIAAKAGEISNFHETVSDNRAEWAPDDRRELNRKQVELTGLQQHRATLVREYNARAGDRTRSFLLDSKLPERLE